MTAGRIAAHFDVRREAISQPLRVLRETGLVAERREGTRRFYRARPEARQEIRAFLDGWGPRLERPRSRAGRAERSKRRGR